MALESLKLKRQAAYAFEDFFSRKLSFSLYGFAEVENRGGVNAETQNDLDVFVMFGSFVVNVVLL